MTELNHEQVAAVTEPSVDFVLSAGAGSGKTRVLTERYAAAVEAGGESAFDSTLAITFTEKAAGELWERVRSRVEAAGGSSLSQGIESAWISTIHSMCSRLLRRHALEIGIDPQFSVGSTVELGVIRKRVFDTVVRSELDSPTIDGADVLFRTFGLPGLFLMVSSMAEQVRAMGLRPADIVTCDAAEPNEIRMLVDCLEAHCDEYGSLPETQTLLGNIAALSELVAAGRVWLEGSSPVGEFARATRCLKQNRRGSQDVKDIAEQALAHTERLGLLVAQLAVGPYERALVELTQRFSDRYHNERRAAGLLDFEDLQGLVIDLFEMRPDIAARYAAQFSSVMVDEFQDTNALQMRLIDSLAPNGIVAVGDEKQSIYRFRHADVDILRRRNQAASVHHTLQTNYRSHPDLVRFFNGIFGSEPFWPGGFLSLAPGRNDEVGAGTALYERRPRVSALLVNAAECGEDKDADEAALLAEYIKELVDEGVLPKDIAILLRAMTAADLFAGALRDVGIEVFVSSGGTYFDRPEVLDLEMLLRLASNTNDTEALAHVLAGPLTAVSENTLGRLRLRAGEGSLWASCRQADRLSIEQADAAGISRLVEVVDALREGKAGTGLSEMIHEACERLEYDLTLFSRGFEGARAWSNVLKLARIAGEFESSSAGGVQAFLDYLELKREIEGRESLAAFAVEGVDAVRIMSIHAAKGLEFPVTVVANLGRSTGRNAAAAVLSTSGGEAFLGMKLPGCAPGGSESIETFGHTQAVRAEQEAGSAEEKRLLYVACTRACELLVLCGRTRFDKEADNVGAIGWLREALGFGSADSIIAGDVAVGDSAVRVLTPVPRGCGPVGLRRPALLPETVRVARDASAIAIGDDQALIDRISYSGLARYRSCPYRYYVSSVARLGSRTPGTSGQDPAVALGNAVHAVLKVAKGLALPGQQRVDEICEFSGLPSDMWPLVSSLARTFLESDTGRRIAACDRTTREMPFSVPLGPIRLDGAIDLIGWEGGRALIVDYKTGRTEPESDPERYRAQAECYAVAAFALGATHVEVRFVELRSECRATGFEYAHPDSDRLRSGLSREIDGLLAGDFEPLSRFDPFACPECPALGNLCPVSAPGRRPSA